LAYNDGNGENASHVRIFEWKNEAWAQLGQDINGEAAGDKSGWSVSLSGTGSVVAVGAKWNDGNAEAAGHTRVFKLEGNTWVQLGFDIDGEGHYDGSGHSVVLTMTRSDASSPPIRSHLYASPYSYSCL
jgi:hypothetical protein